MANTYSGSHSSSLDRPPSSTPTPNQSLFQRPLTSPPAPNFHTHRLSTSPHFRSQSTTSYLTPTFRRHSPSPSAPVTAAGFRSRFDHLKIILQKSMQATWRLFHSAPPTATPRNTRRFWAVAFHSSSPGFTPPPSIRSSTRRFVDMRTVSIANEAMNECLRRLEGGLAVVGKAEKVCVRMDAEEAEEERATRRAETRMAMIRSIARVLDMGKKKEKGERKVGIKEVEGMVEWMGMEATLGDKARIWVERFLEELEAT